MSDARLVWCELVWPQAISTEDAVNAVRSMALDPTGTKLVLEARGCRGQVRYLLGCDGWSALRRIARLLGATPIRVGHTRKAAATGRRLRLSTSRRPLASGRLDVPAIGILSALTATRTDAEELTVQVLLGARIPATTVPATAQASGSWWRLLLGAEQTRLDPEARAALTAKSSLPGFRAEIRLGVAAATPVRRQSLTLGLLGALRLLESPGITVWLTPIAAGRLGNGDHLTWPWRLGLRLNAAEVTGLAGLPVIDSKTDLALPGLPPAHPRQLAPNGPLPPRGKDRVTIAWLTAPGSSGLLTRSTAALVRHLHVVGPTGTGKTALLLNVALQDIAAGRGVVVMDPKGDLVTDLLARIPAKRTDDVVVLDPLAGHIVGVNPLADLSDGASVEVRADHVLTIFTGLFGTALGPRTTDILHASLLTLARRADASLVQIPRLLADPAFRAPRIADVLDDVALGPFWTWYQGLKDSERTTVIAPLMNKLRAVLLAPSVRRVLGQVHPHFSVRQVFTENKVLLIPLPVGQLGGQNSQLLGSLVCAQVWDAARARTATPMVQRRPVSVVLDEAQTFLGYQTDIADALATSRSYQVGWTLAHQHLSQLPISLRDAVLTNCRSRIVFQTSHADASVFATQTAGPHQLTAEDFTSFPAFAAYVSLYEHGHTQPYTSATTLPPPPAIRDPDQLRALVTSRWGRTPDDIEAAFTTRSSTTSGGPSGTTGKPDQLTTTPTPGLGRRPRHGRTSEVSRPSSRSSNRSRDDTRNTPSQRAEPRKPRNATPASPAACSPSEPDGGGQS